MPELTELGTLEILILAYARATTLKQTVSAKIKLRQVYSTDMSSLCHYELEIETSHPMHA